MSSLRFSSHTAVLCVAALTLASCAGQSQALRESAAQHVYSQPLAEVWPQVEAFMTEQGYTFETAPTQHALRTDWRENGTSGATRTLVNYLIQGERHPSGGCILRVSRGIKADPNHLQGDPSAMYMPGSSAMEQWNRMAENELNQSQRPLYAPARDVDMELALMRRLDPSAVAKVEGKDASAAR